VACGTAEHARLLGEVHGFEVDGIDLDPAMVAIARTRYPRGRFEVADMADFHLGRSYDAVLCLYSSIGYVATLPRLHRAVAYLREHIAPGSWSSSRGSRPTGVTPGPGGSHTVESHGLRVTCDYRSEHHGQLSRQNVVTPLGLERVPVATSVREDPPVTDGEPGAEQDARGHEQTRAVASLATVLADAVLAGDHERARALAEALQELLRVAGGLGAIVTSNGYTRRR